MQETILSFKAGSDVPGKITSAGPRHLHPQQFRGLRVETLSAVLSKLERGDVEAWADLAEVMIRDPHVRTVSETRMTSVVGSEIVVEAGATRTPDEASRAERMADAFREELESVSDLEGVLTHLLHAENVGWAGCEHGWTFNGTWHSEPTVIPNRDLRFTDEWKIQARTYDRTEYGGTVGRWFDLDRQDRYMIHVPLKLGPPHMTGDFLAIAWHWLAKRWAFLFRNTGLEKFANPFRVGTVPAGASKEARQRLERAFMGQSSDHWMIVEDGVTVELVSTQGTGAVWTDALKDIRGEITRCLLGSDLNTEVGDTGGNRALGESQHDSTTAPRQVVMSRRLAAVLKDQWAKPFARFNSHLVDGQIAATPTIKFKLVDEAIEKVDDLTVDVGGATVDDVRRGNGLSEWGEAGGGEAVATRSGPRASAPATAPGRGGATLPLAASRRRRPKSAAKTSQTSFDYQSPIEGLPFGSSVGQEPLLPGGC